MTTQLDGYIEVDDKGVARIAGSRIKVINLVMEKLANGLTADQLHDCFPHLTLAQIYAALTYYYAQQAECDRQIEASVRFAEEMRAASPETPFEKRLRALKLGSPTDQTR